MWDGTLPEDGAFTLFEKNLSEAFSNTASRMSFADTQLVFFPISAHDHYYLVVFNLKRTAFNIIDNSAACTDYEAKYKDVASVLHTLFARHLQYHYHPKADSIARARPSVLKMKWKTVHNRTDCGVFVMCHMDTYTGEAVSKWNCGLCTESATGDTTQKKLLNFLRFKYLTKILLHPVNVQRDRAAVTAAEYQDKYSCTVAKDMMKNALLTRDARAAPFV